jgi:hypothetical protein
MKRTPSYAGAQPHVPATRTVRAFLSFLLLLFVLPGTVSAQATEASIRGTVRGAAGGAILNAELLVAKEIL